MATNYTLTVKGARIDGTTKKPTDLTIKTNSNNNDYQIKSLSYEKRLYSPCCVNMELSLLNSAITLFGIKNDFERRTVSLTVTDSADAVIATDYFVYHCNPVFAASGCSIFLTMYSRDKLLTLDKFNKVYLNKQLGNGIIKEMLDRNTGLLKNCNVNFDVQRLQFLSYDYIAASDTQQQVTTWSEVIQPYRVQYNEDFYSFISRIACRCGEFLYFEDGKLKLGLDTDSTVIEITSENIISKEYPSYSNSGLTVTSCFRDYFKNDTASSTADLPCSDYGAVDEYFDVLDKGNLPDSARKELYPPDIVELAKCSLLPMAGRLFVGKEIYTASAKAARFVLDATALGLSYKFNSDYVNDKFKKDFFDPTPAIEKQQKDGNLLSQFADVREDGYGKLLNKQLSEIRDKEMEAARNTVRVRVKTGFAASKGIKLGNTVKLDNLEYRVVSCTGEYFKTDKLVGITEDNTLDYKKEITDITAFELAPIPLTTASATVPQRGTCYPPYDKCAESAPAAPQTAIVTADNDPRYIGRVRVRYTWQKDSEPGSPWVRVLSPLASSSGAVHFQPKKGDEVMLGYIDGNIDRPYVAGSLFINDTKKIPIHDALFSPYNDTIRVGSQRLDFRTGTIQNWFDSVIPFAGMVNSFLPGQMVDLTQKLDDKSDFAKGLHGITRLTDTNSIWKIEGNTADRSVTIKSAWGKVTINAYTGIEIESAGDINIKGKNISISAQNNIRIESGIAIKNARKSAEIDKEGLLSKLKEIVKATIEDLAFGSIDLSLIRTVWESIVPPKEGTLKIKSNRYLALEAGRGEAFDNENIGQAADDIKRFSCANINGEHFTDLVNDINAIHWAVGKYDELYEKKSKLNRVKDTYIANLDAIKGGIAYFNNLSGIDDILGQAENASYDVVKLRDYQNCIKIVIDIYERRKRDLYDIGVTEDMYSKAMDWKITIHNLLQEKKIADQDVPIYLPKLVDCARKIKEAYFEGKKPKNVKPQRIDVFRDAVKLYLDSSDILTKPAGNLFWNDYVAGLKINESATIVTATDVGNYIVEKMGLASDAEYERIYNDASYKNVAEGRILMSQDKDKSMQIEGGTIKVTANDALESVRKALLQGFPIALWNG